MTAPRLRTALVVALLLASAACTSDEVGASPSSGSASGSTAPVAPVPVPAAAAAAAKINLTAADLPGFTARPTEQSRAPGRSTIDAELARCLGASTDEPAAYSSSDTFAGGPDGALKITSAVTTFPDPAQAAKDVAAFSGPASIRCLSAYLTDVVKSGAGQAAAAFSPPGVTRVMLTSPGADSVYGVRLTTDSATASGQRVVFTVDLLGIAKGRTKTTLVAGGVGTGIPEDQRAALFGQLVERTVAHGL